MSDRTDVLLEEVRGMFKTLADGVVGNTEAIEGLRIEVGELRQAQERTELRVAGLAQRMDRVEARLGRVEERLDRVEERLDRIEERLDGVETRLDGVEADLASVRSELRELREETDRRFKALDVN